MANIPEISNDLLNQDLSEKTLLAYIKKLDPKRAEARHPSNIEMLVALLKVCDYRKIADLHNRVKFGWKKFLDYEKTQVQSGYPLSGTMLIYFAILMSDAESRNKICSEEQLRELAEYFDCQ